MDVRLHPDLIASAHAQRAASATEACVHCGFCLATCPTYLDTRDERDSPRGRIYLLREFLQTGSGGETARHHLDRCLSCRACETTCPSGVRYAQLADAGRALLEEQAARPLWQRIQRWLLRRVVPYRQRFSLLLRLGRMLRPLLPPAQRAQLPARQLPLTDPKPRRTHPRRVLLLEGCVQAVATPRSNQAARLLLDAFGIAVVESPAQGCCGALNSHLGAIGDGRDDMRRNIDAWWPAIAAGAEAVISTATGCGSQLADYGEALADDPAYASRAACISERACDLAGFLLRQTPWPDVPSRALRGPVAVQVPCSQYHALRQPDAVRALLTRCGYRLAATRDDHLCCGSAGSYSLLQPALSRRLRERKLEALSAGSPAVIASANVGCQLHLGGATELPVLHWSELAWEALRPAVD
jgi:glycolate oxidase iron-sulfur subunit